MKKDNDPGWDWVALITGVPALVAFVWYIIYWFNLLYL